MHTLLHRIFRFVARFVGVYACSKKRGSGSAYLFLYSWESISWVSLRVECSKNLIPGLTAEKRGVPGKLVCNPTWEGQIMLKNEISFPNTTKRSLLC